MCQALSRSAVLTGLVCLLGLSPVSQADDQVLALKAGRIDCGDGNSITRGVVLIRAGRIEALGTEVTIPDGAKVIELADGVITPGLIDAHATVTRAKWGIQSNGWQGRVDSEPHGTDFAAEDHDENRPHWNFPLVQGTTVSNCSDACPMAYRHITGQKCKCCGFPEADALVAALGVSPRRSVAEASSEVVPHTNVMDSIDLQSPDFERLARRGVTTVFVSTDSGSVIGARGAIVKTGGPADQRIVRRTDAVKAAMGSDPSRRGGSNRLPRGTHVSFHARRPHTRMGVTWVFRKALHEARAVAGGLPQIGGADTPPTGAIEPLVAVLKGELPLRIQARTQSDILTALRLADEFGLRFTLEEATEAYRCLNELQAAQIPVVYGPVFIEPTGWRAYTGEARKAKLTTARALLDAGVEMALTANEMRDEEGLAAQAMYAMRYGLTGDEALAAVTSAPARILGIDDRVGTLGEGKDADLVVWSGPPFASTSRIQTVVVGGELVFDAG